MKKIRIIGEAMNLASSDLLDVHLPYVGIATFRGTGCDDALWYSIREEHDAFRRSIREEHDALWRSIGEAVGMELAPTMEDYDVLNDILSFGGGGAARTLNLSFSKCIQSTYCSSFTPKYSFSTFLSSDSMIAKRSRTTPKQSQTASQNMFQEASISLSMNLGGIVEMKMDVKMQVKGEWINKEPVNYLLSFYQITEQLLHQQIVSSQKDAVEALQVPLQTKIQPWREGRQKIEIMLRHGEVMESIEYISRYLKLINPKKSVCKDFTVLSGRFNYNEKRHMLGDLGEAEYNQERSKIVLSLCILIEELEHFFKE
jgi:hypothetical protein